MDSTENIFDQISPLRTEFTQLLLKALEEGLLAVKSAKDSGKYFGKFYEFPSLSFRDNGLPNLSTSFDSGPIQYSNGFIGYGGSPSIDEDKITSFNELVQFVRSHAALHRRFAIKGMPPETESKVQFDKINILLKAKDCIERYIHQFNSFDYDESNAKEAISSKVAFIFDEVLSIDIAIPILFLNFQFENYQLADGVFIEEITELEHKARYGIKSYNSSAHEQVMLSATHALIFKDWHIKNSEQMWGFDALSNIRAYPIELIDQFFGALRINSSKATGYSQIYAIAKNWEAGSKANLPYLQGATTRAYPNWFENYYWISDTIPIITEDEIEAIKITYNILISSAENSLNLALRRLNRCVVRDDNEDAILDATIALEALLSDGNQEMTHKLAMRVGALVNLDVELERDSVQAFSDIKSIYSYRSAIVHGSRDLDKKREIKLSEEKTVPAHSMAIDYLKLALRVLLKHERYRVPKKIDEDLLLGHLKKSVK